MAEGAWVQSDGKVWEGDNQAWKQAWGGQPSVTYAYNRGDQCTAVTGGWVTSSQHTYPGPLIGYSAYTKNKIGFANYDAVTIIYNIATSGTYTYYSVNVSASDPWDTIIKVLIDDKTAGTHTSTVNVTDFNQSAYLTATCANNPYYSHTGSASLRNNSIVVNDNYVDYIDVTLTVYEIQLIKY